MWPNLPREAQLARHAKNRTVTGTCEATIAAAELVLKPVMQPPTLTPVVAAENEEKNTVAVNTALKSARRWHRQLERQMPEVSDSDGDIQALVKLQDPPENNASDSNVIERLASGDLSPAHSATARSNVVYHTHYHGGSGGIAFVYIEHEGDVFPVLADYAPTRQKNDYIWNTAGRSGGAGVGFETVHAAVKSQLGWE